MKQTVVWTILLLMTALTLQAETLKEAWSEVKDGSKEAWSETKEGSKKAYHDTVGD